MNTAKYITDLPFVQAALPVFIAFGLATWNNNRHFDSLRPCYRETCAACKPIIAPD